ncbi:protein translocase subunit SecD [Myxacorys almedinensis]|uniref:Protein translocase subunit SecD n=1 Tax=Myxacorys almedinensis A TaxID=2690445 RepID=A0A8J8CJV3_9CYAN|nr:protein translocase subunit SecD [Myxacorys almedinensis]NDJ15935.1 protein translocase subunit SecD [Myxacorys almedinensis A]
MGRQRGLLLLILALVIASIIVIVKVPTRLGLDLRGGSQLTIQVNPSEEVKQITERELEAVQKVIEGRINGLGVSEPVIQTVGENQVVVQLPGVDNPQQAERVLGGTAQLDFRSENPTQIAFLQVRQEELQELQAKQPALEKAGDQAAIAANQSAIAAKEKQVEDAIKQVYEKTGLDGRYLRDARTELQGNSWAVGISFDQKGADLFADLTKKAVQTNTRLGIFLDDQLLSAPTVPAEFAQTGIIGGNAIITGNFTAESAKELELQLRGGSLPVPIQIVENRTVGATLGQDSIRSSIIAGIGGLILVLAFMIVYYRLPGVISAIALTIYALLTFAAFNLLGVTLTLPGIAGFVLSIGMAVDANVLIFERTREELRAGKTLYRSVESGFFRAFSSILDSNVTTLIACAALFWLGAGLVRGFALTLALGVVISMFTALTCSRTLMLYVLSIQSLRKPELFCPNLRSKPPVEVTS